MSCIKQVMLPPRTVLQLLFGLIMSGVLMSMPRSVAAIGPVAGDDTAGAFHPTETSASGQTRDDARNVKPDRMPLLSERYAVLMSVIPTVSSAILVPVCPVATQRDYPSDRLPVGFAMCQIMAGVGFSVGPSIGHFYAAHTKYGLISSGGRALGYTIAVSSAVGVTNILYNGEDEDPNSDTRLGFVPVLIIVGGVRQSQRLSGPYTISQPSGAPCRRRT